MQWWLSWQAVPESSAVITTHNVSIALLQTIAWDPSPSKPECVKEYIVTGKRLVPGQGSSRVL